MDLKRIFALLLAFFLLLALIIPVFAASPKIVDNADLLIGSEVSDLEHRAQAIANQYGMDVVIVTVDSLNGRYIESYADDYYDNNGYGIGPDCSGVLLLIAMDTREWAISTCGSAINALPDHAIDALFDAMSGNLSSGNYYRAFENYLDELDHWFERFQEAQTVNVGDYLRVIFFSLLIGAAVGGIAILVMRSQMNTAKAQSGAGSYLKNGSYNLTRRLDIFLYSRVSKTRRAQSSGSSTHRGSGGRSHGGGHGRF